MSNDHGFSSQSKTGNTMIDCAMDISTSTCPDCGGTGIRTVDFDTMHEYIYSTKTQRPSEMLQIYRHWKKTYITITRMGEIPCECTEGR